MVPLHWTHQGLSKDENLFDGSFRLFRKGQQLWDARHLPAEPVAEAGDPSAEAAREDLNALFEKIAPKGPRPPEAF